MSFSAGAPNNIWMNELGPAERVVDRMKAEAQWHDLYSFIAQHANVFLLPVTKGVWNLQDQVYVANLAAVVPEWGQHGIAVVSNFKAEERTGESRFGFDFFQSLGLPALMPPYTFEGEAELKRLKTGVYVGGYGQRTDRRALHWIAENLGVSVVAVEERDPKLYHLDCSILPVTPESAAVCTEVYSQQELRCIEHHVNVIDVPLPVAHAGACNSMFVGPSLLTASHIEECVAGSDEFESEKWKVEWLAKEIAGPQNLELELFDLSEFLKSGALLSCLVMNLRGAAG